ncbi:hypothetical protein [Macrococcoides bohemicum]|uniref:hypothetical protein n=1 Tax=Macrococcoides bohemicum TaxID=1903056 RepID=UPI00165D4F55|nr:hypothetical protein [Macrococcus bohemicus]MBC9873668.1 hypothetical protein [Macrococcus bohemicus]
MNDIIKTAIIKKNAAYENYIEKVFEAIERKILWDATYGMTSSLITEDTFYQDGRELKVLFSNNTERLINDLAEHLEIDKDLIKRVYNARTDGEARVNAIHINWGEADA